MNPDDSRVISEPRLEDFGLSPTFYHDYVVEKSSLQEELVPIKDDIQRIEKKILVQVFEIVLGIIGLFGSLLFLIWIYVIIFAFTQSILYGILSLVGLGLLWLLFEHWPWWLSPQNIFSFGRFKKLEDKQKKIEKKIQALQDGKIEQVKLFEENSRRFYQSQLEDFVKNHLYRKKSGNSRFEAALVEFANMIETFSETNKLFLTSDGTRGFESFRQYLGNRFYGHKFQESHTETQFSVAEQLLEQNKKAQKTKTSLPPQEKFRHPRKIDWNDVQSTRSATGLEGEEVALGIEKKYLVSIGKPELAARVAHTSKEQGDGLGYDIVSYFPDGREKFIEVKSTTGKIESPYFMSVNELAFLKENLETYFLYRVALVVGNVEASSLEIITASDILSNYYIVPSQFKVGLKKEAS